MQDFRLQHCFSQVNHFQKFVSFELQAKSIINNACINGEWRSGEFSATKAQREVVKIFFFDFSYWA